jgi:hypothetical protein
VLKPWLNKYWCIPEASGEYVAHMEDVLETYKRPYDPRYPVICLDETSRQLIAETRPSLPPKPGHVKKTDFEYRRHGTVNLFMMFEPWTGWRHVEVTSHRRRCDFAECVRKLIDEYCPQAEKVVLVMDNLNTHTIGSLYEAFSPDEARRLAEKLEIHYTPKHGSWLNMAEIEIGILSRQCLAKYIDTRAKMEKEISSWETARNNSQNTVDWQFTTKDARIKLKRLYPSL